VDAVLAEQITHVPDRGLTVGQAGPRRD